MANKANFRVAVGKDLGDLEILVEGEGDDPARLIDQASALTELNAKAKEEVGRHRFGEAIVVVLAVALSIATVWGWLSADFSGLQQVWAAGSVPLGWVAGYYFRKHDST